MTDSLRDQLLKLGIAKKAEATPKSAPPKPRDGRNSTVGVDQRRADARVHDNAVPTQVSRNRPLASRSSAAARAAPSTNAEEIDLAKAYALRERRERAEQLEVRQAAEAKAALRRAGKIKLRELTYGKAQNDANGDQARHFPHAGKIKRIYVNDAQLGLLNAGELGVVVIEGRYLLVDRAVALAVAQVQTEALVLLPEPGAADDCTDAGGTSPWMDEVEPRREQRPRAASGTAADEAEWPLPTSAE